jgi:uncharacterized phosphatase
MKTVYFVRHGESEGNASTVMMGYKGALTETGRAQALELAERCSSLPIELVISSTLQRARETTEIFLSKNKLPVEYSDLFIERMNPSEIIGKAKDDPVGAEIRKTIWANFKEGWRHSDEENFDDLKSRAIKALNYILARSEEHILVSGHGIFTRILLAAMLFGGDVTGAECGTIIKKIHTDNSGISICKYNDVKQVWEILTWNDKNHLEQSESDDLTK